MIKVRTIEKEGSVKPNLTALLKEIKKLPWLFIKNLKFGDVLRIRTVNKQPGKEPQHVFYRVKIVNPETGTVRLAIYRKGRKTEKVSGKILGSAIAATDRNLTVIKQSGLAVGFAMVFEAEDFGKLKLFPAQEIWLNGKKILPDLSKIKKREK